MDLTAKQTLIARETFGDRVVVVGTNFFDRAIGRNVDDQSASGFT